MLYLVGLDWNRLKYTGICGKKMDLVEIGWKMLEYAGIGLNMLQ